MANIAQESDKNLERRRRVLVGALPFDFLRIDQTACETLNDQQRQEALDAETAMALDHEMATPAIPYANNTMGRLTLTIVQARLNKNYGMVRMDPYVRVRVGHHVYETTTDNNGGKTPKWNRDIVCLLPQGVTTMQLEIFDECSFTVDELIAWAMIGIPPNVLKGETCDDWFPLSGKLGDGLEGMINVVMTYSPVTVAGMYGYYPPVGPQLAPIVTIPGYGVHGYRQIPVATAVAPPMPVPEPSALDLKLIEEMFPNVDKEVVKSVYEANRFHKERTVHSLLQLAE